jgi:hypothetical protein
MRKDWIMTESEREEKKKKIEENRRKKSSGSLLLTENSNSSVEQLHSPKSYRFSYSDISYEECKRTHDYILKPIRRRRRRRRHSFFDKNASKNSPHSYSNKNEQNIENLSKSPCESDCSLLNVNELKNNEEIEISYEDNNENEFPYSQKSHQHTKNNSNKLFMKRKDFSTAKYSSEAGEKISNINSALSKDLYRSEEHDDSKTFNSEDVLKKTSILSKQSLIPPYERIFNSKISYTTNQDQGFINISKDSTQSTEIHNSTNLHAENVTDSLPETLKYLNEYSKLMNYSLSLPTNKSSNLMNEIERHQVNAIREAYKQAIKLVKAQGTPRNPEDINTTINVTELGVRRLIFYFKLISDFRNLEHDLMVKLLKHNMMSLLQIHGVNSYNKSDNTFKEPNTDDTPFSANSLEIVYGPEIYKLIMSITLNLYSYCQKDMIHIKILMLIVLFDPSNENLDENEKLLVARLLNKYISLLYSYMNEKIGNEKASYLFKSVLFEVNRCKDLALWFERAVIEKSNYDYIRPLMKEVFSFPNDTPPSSISTNVSSISIPNSNISNKDNY